MWFFIYNSYAKRQRKRDLLHATLELPIAISIPEKNIEEK